MLHKTAQQIVYLPLFVKPTMLSTETLTHAQKPHQLAEHQQSQLGGTWILERYSVFLISGYDLRTMDRTLVSKTIKTWEYMLLGHLSHPSDILLWVCVRRRATCVVRCPLTPSI